jgi:hypothetical protein
VELYEPQEMQRTMRGQLASPPRIKTALQWPHLYSTVALGISIAGGAEGTPSMSGAGTTLRTFCKRAGIAATSLKFEPNMRSLRPVTNFYCSERKLDVRRQNAIAVSAPASTLCTDCFA